MSAEHEAREAVPLAVMISKSGAIKSLLYSRHPPKQAQHTAEL